MKINISKLKTIPNQDFGLCYYGTDDEIIEWAKYWNIKLTVSSNNFTNLNLEDINYSLVDSERTCNRCY